MFIRKRRYQRKPKRAVRRTLRKPKVSLATKRYVNRAIHRTDENKVWIDYYSNQAITTASNTTPTNINLVPTISQGTGHYQRVGNKVNIRSGYVKGYVNLLPYSATQNPQVGPQYVKMWIVSSKSLNTNTLSSTSIANDFLETGSSSTGLTGTILDMCFGTNDSVWKVHASKTAYLGTTSYATSQLVSAGIAQDNSRMSAPFYFNITKALKKNLLFNDSNTTATNANLWLIFQAVYCDGSTTLIRGSEFHCFTKIQYEDA